MCVDGGAAISGQSGILGNPSGFLELLVAVVADREVGRARGPRLLSAAAGWGDYLPTVDRYRRPSRPGAD